MTQNCVYFIDCFCVCVKSFRHLIVGSGTSRLGFLQIFDVTRRDKVGVKIYKQCRSHIAVVVLDGYFVQEHASCCK